MLNWSTYRRIAFLDWKPGDVAGMLLRLNGAVDARTAAVIIVNSKWKRDSSDNAMNHCCTVQTSHIYGDKKEKCYTAQHWNTVLHKLVTQSSLLSNVTLMEYWCPFLSTHGTLSQSSMRTLDTAPTLEPGQKAQKKLHF